MRRWTNSAGQLSTVVGSYMLSNIFIGGGAIVSSCFGV